MKLSFFFFFLFFIFFINVASASSFGFNNENIPFIERDFKFIKQGGDSVSGNYDFNGGYFNGGLSIIGGNLFAQIGYFYNITSINVTKENLRVIENLNVTQNVTARYFIGDGSLLTGIVAGTGNTSWNESHANTLFYNKTSNIDLGEYNITASYFIGNGSLLTDIQISTYNITYDALNSTYGKFWYNQTLGSIAYIDIGDANLQANITAVNTSLIDRFDNFNYNQSLWNLSDGKVYQKDLNYKVGIGTTTPQQTLNVIGDVNITGDFLIEKDILISGGFFQYDAEGESYFYGSVQFGEDISLKPNTGRVTAKSFFLPGEVVQIDPTSIFSTVNIILDEASIGIDTYNPTAKLDVRGNVSITGQAYLWNLSVIENVSARYFIGDGSLLTGITGGNMSWNETHAYTLFYNKTANIDLGGYNLTTTTGRVGIGTTTPRDALHVVGNITFEGDGTTTRINTSETLSIGLNAEATGEGATAIGFNVKALFEGAVSIGSRTQATHLYSTAVGYGAESTDLITTSVGYFSKADGQASTAVGNNAQAYGIESTAIGTFAVANHEVSTVIGYSAQSTKDEQIVLGTDLSEVYILGKLGIGEDNPNYKLQVNGTTAINGSLFVAGINVSNWLYNQTLESGGNMSWNETHAYTLFYNKTANIDLGGYNLTTTTGRVGIGTNDPKDKLHVVGNITFEGNVTINAGNNYLVKDNKYAFISNSFPKSGLFFNTTSVGFEFKNTDGGRNAYIGAGTVSDRSWNKKLNVGGTDLTLSNNFDFEVLGNSNFTGNIVVNRGNITFGGNSALRIAAGKHAFHSADYPLAGVIFNVSSAGVEVMNVVGNKNHYAGAGTFLNHTWGRAISINATAMHAPAYPLHVTSNGTNGISIHSLGLVRGAGFVDATEFPNKDFNAVNVVKNIKSEEKGLSNAVSKLDHKTLPEFAYKTWQEPIYEMVWNETLNEPILEIIGYNKQEGRVINNMVSINTKALQELIEENEKMKLELELMKKDLCSLGIERWCKK